MATYGLDGDGKQARVSITLKNGDKLPDLIVGQTTPVGYSAFVRVEGRDGPANRERLCVKGRFGFDYVAHPQRLTKPLIRREGVPKSADFTMDPARSLSAFREATWDEAMLLAADSFRRIRDTRGPKALAGFGSAKGSNDRSLRNSARNDASNVAECRRPAAGSHHPGMTH